MAIHPPPAFHGQAETALGLDDLAAAPAGEEIAAEVRESSHHAGGRYLRPWASDGADVTLERIGPRETIVRAGGDGDALADGARLVSATLGRPGIRHRFEPYGDENAMLIYLQHSWPQTSAEAP
jgi:hypothetical protein